MAIVLIAGGAIQNLHGNRDVTTLTGGRPAQATLVILHVEHHRTT